MSSNCSSFPSGCTVGMHIGYNIFMTGFGILGVVTNVLNIIVFSRNVLRGSTITYMKGMAIVDLVTCSLNVPFGLMKCTLTKGVEKQMYRFYTFFIFLPIANAFAGCSIWTTVAMSADRLLCVTKPYLGKTICTVANARKVVILLFISSLAMHFPFFFTHYINKNGEVVNSMFSGTAGFKAFTWIRAVMVKFVPLLLVIVLNAFLLRSVLHSIVRHKRMVRPRVVLVSPSDSKPPADNAQAVRVTPMLLSASFIYVVCHILEPFSHSSIFAALFGKCVHRSFIFQHFITATNTLETASYAINIFPYCIFNGRFRHELILVLRCKSQASGNGDERNTINSDAANSDSVVGSERNTRHQIHTN